MPEKEEIFKVRNSRKMYIPIYIMIFILILTIFFINISGKIIDNFVFNMVLIFILAGFVLTELHRLRDSYSIDDSSVTHKHGIIIRKTRKVALGAISDADFKQNPYQMILGIGDVNIRMFAEEAGIKMGNIPEPKKFINILEDKIGKRVGH